MICEYFFPWGSHYGEVGMDDMVSDPIVAAVYVSSPKLCGKMDLEGGKRRTFTYWLYI